MGTVEALPSKSHLKDTFDLIYFSSSQVHYFTPAITDLLKGDASVVVENVKYITPLGDEQEVQFIPKIMEMGVAAKCQVKGKPDKLHDNIIFNYHRVDDS